MSARKILVHWFPIDESLRVYFSRRPPISLLRYYTEKYRGVDTPAELYCPAVRHTMQNTFVFYCPSKFSFRFNIQIADEMSRSCSKTFSNEASSSDLRALESITDGSKLVESGVVTADWEKFPAFPRKCIHFHPLTHGRDSTPSVTFQFNLDLIFATTSNLWLEQLPPYLHDQIPGNCLIIPGAFDFAHWVRNLSTGVKIRDLSESVSFEEDDALFYVRFFTDNPYDQVTLKVAELDADSEVIRKAIRTSKANVAVKKFAPGRSWAYIQERFRGWKTKAGGSD